MRINVKSKNGNAPESLKQYAEKKVRKLSRYFFSIQKVDIEQTTERGRHIIELSLEGDGLHLRSQERATASRIRSIHKCMMMMRTR